MRRFLLGFAFLLAACGDDASSGTPDAGTPCTTDESASQCQRCGGPPADRGNREVCANDFCDTYCVDHGGYACLPQFGGEYRWVNVVVDCPHGDASVDAQ
jgi:hypothetical protein